MAGQAPCSIEALENQESYYILLACYVDASHTLLLSHVGVMQVVGCIVEHEGKILLCKRAIDPCKGKWTLPAGYMELKESSAGDATSHSYTNK